MYLADLTFIEEIPSHLKNGMINFEKMMLVGKVIADVERFQRSPYSFYSVPPIEEYLNNLSTYTEKELYDTAKAMEQRDKEELGNMKRSKKKADNKVDEWMSVYDGNKQIKDLEKQEKRLQRNISFRSQQQQQGRSRNARSSTFT